MIRKSNDIFIPLEIKTNEFANKISKNDLRCVEARPQWIFMILVLSFERNKNRAGISALKQYSSLFFYFVHFSASQRFSIITTKVLRFIVRYLSLSKLAILNFVLSHLIF